MSLFKNLLKKGVSQDACEKSSPTGLDFRVLNGAKLLSSEQKSDCGAGDGKAEKRRSWLFGSEHRTVLKVNYSRFIFTKVASFIVSNFSVRMFLMHYRQLLKLLSAWISKHKEVSFIIGIATGTVFIHFFGFEPILWFLVGIIVTLTFLAITDDRR
jgi:hypothetical protein